MRLGAEQCWERLRVADHGVLCTTNARGDIDAVPVCFAVVAAWVTTAIDRVKPKETTELGRLKNLARNATATLLCEHWDRDDWSRLWWVRARLVRCPVPQVRESVREECEAALRAKYQQYGAAAFADVIVFDVKGVLGWAADDRPAGDRLVDGEPLR